MSRATRCEFCARPLTDLSRAYRYVEAWEDAQGEVVEDSVEPRGDRWACVTCIARMENGIELVEDRPAEEGES